MESSTTADREAYRPERMVRPHLSPATAYSPGVSPELDRDIVRLDWNESPFGLSPRAQAAYDAFRTGNRYPDFGQSRLITALAAYIGTTSDRVIAGAGLDDVFTTLALAIIEPGDEVIISDPTFGVYRNLFTLHGATIVNVPLGRAPDFALDVDCILAATTVRTKLIIVCNPNNPTGTLFRPADIARIVGSSPCLVAIDEAYAEFSGVSHIELADRNENVILLRTLSKFAGLAGYRCGYGVFSTSLMPWIRVAAPPFYNLTAITAEVAIASLADIDHLRGNVMTLVAERDALAERINAHTVAVAYPSAANFLLISLKGMPSAPIVEELAQHRIVVRHFASPAYGLTDCLRVSIGTPRENALFLSQFEGALANTPVEQPERALERT